MARGVIPSCVQIDEESNGCAMVTACMSSLCTTQSVIFPPLFFLHMARESGVMCECAHSTTELLMLSIAFLSVSLSDIPVQEPSRRAMCSPALLCRAQHAVQTGHQHPLQLGTPSRLQSVHKKGFHHCHLCARQGDA